MIVIMICKVNKSLYLQWGPLFCLSGFLAFLDMTLEDIFRAAKFEHQSTKYKHE